MLVDATAADLHPQLRAAIQPGKHIVTANKALLSKRGNELFAAAHAAGAEILSEATTLGKVPVVFLASYHRHLRPKSVQGQLSGTCGHVMSAMEEGLSFEEALANAQQLGFAEADPSYDVEARDSLSKALLFGLSLFQRQGPGP